MPKYYRFRATTPTRKVRQIKEKDVKKEVQEPDRSKKRALFENLLVGLSLLCAPAPAWYLRRTAWRENPTVLGPIRQLAITSAGAGVGRPVIVIKRSPDITRYL